MSNILYFARINFEPQIEAKTPEEHIEKIKKEKNILLKIISSKADIYQYLVNSEHSVLVKNNVTWRFGGIKSGDDYIYGRLGKVKGRMTDNFDESIQDFKSKVQTSTSVCNFLIDLNNHVYAYEYKRNVGPKAPMFIIETAFNSYYKTQNKKMTLDPLLNREELLQKISELKVITSVKLNLYPTNPDSTPSSKKMDDLIKDLRANKLTIELNASKIGDGIDLNAADGIITSGIRQAEEGHGSARIEGLKESIIPEEKGKSKVKTQVIDSINLPIRKEVTMGKNANENIPIFIRTTSDLMKMYR